MIALDELKKLPIEERIQIVEELTKSIDEEEGDFKESPELTAELQRRYSEYIADPSSGISWNELKAGLLSGRE